MARALWSAHSSESVFLVAPCIIKWHNFKVLVFFFFKVKWKIGNKQNNSQYQQ